MKHFIFVALFIVSWQEHELKQHDDRDGKPGVGVHFYDESHIFYTVETVDKSIKMKTQDDVDKFTGYDGPCKDNNAGKEIEVFNEAGDKAFIHEMGKHSWCSEKGFIKPGAFNITVKEVKE